MDASQHSMAKTKARDLTLKFRVWADETGTLAQQQAQLQQRKDAFMTVLQTGAVAIKVPDVSDKTYNLVYTGQNIAFNYNTLRTSCSIAAKFVEALYAQPPVPVPPAPTPIPVYPLEVENAPIVITADTTWSATYRVINAEGTITVTSSSPNITAEITTVSDNPCLRVRSTTVLQADQSATVTVTAGTESVQVPVTATAPVCTLAVDRPVEFTADTQYALFPILNAVGSITVQSSSADIIADTITQNNTTYLRVCSDYEETSTALTATITITDSNGSITLDAVATPVVFPPFTIDEKLRMVDVYSSAKTLVFAMRGTAPYTIRQAYYNCGGLASGSSQASAIRNYFDNGVTIAISGAELTVELPRYTSIRERAPLLVIDVEDSNSLTDTVIISFPYTPNWLRKEI